MIASYQTFPITNKTFIGTATAKLPFGERLLRANEDGDITFVFPSWTETITVTAGFDCVLSSDCSAVTSTSEIMMS